MYILLDFYEAENNLPQEHGRSTWKQYRLERTKLEKVWLKCTLIEVVSKKYRGD